MRVEEGERAHWLASARVGARAQARTPKRDVNIFYGLEVYLLQSFHL